MRGEDNVENIIEAETFELELISNLSSSTEIKQGTKENNLRRSKSLTKTNPIIRLNNPVSSDYRKYRQKVESSIDNNPDTDDNPRY